MLGRWCVIASEGLSKCVFGPFSTYEEASEWIAYKQVHTKKEIDYQISLLFTKEGD